MNTKYKPLLIDFEIPDDLKDIINQYIQYLNSGNRNSDDYYRTEIKLTLNWCYRESLLTENQIDLLRKYYQNGGILEDSEDMLRQEMKEGKLLTESLNLYSDTKSDENLVSVTEKNDLSDGLQFDNPSNIIKLLDKSGLPNSKLLDIISDVKMQLVAREQITESRTPHT